MGPEAHEVLGYHHGGDTHGGQADRQSGAPPPDPEHPLEAETTDHRTPGAMSTFQDSCCLLVPRYHLLLKKNEHKTAGRTGCEKVSLKEARHCEQTDLAPLITW